MFNIGRRDAVPTRALEAFEDFGKHRVAKLLRFLEVTCVKATLNRLLTEYLANIRRNAYANIPTVAAAALATPTFEIGVVCQWDMPHMWHPLSNIRPQYVIER